MSVETVDYEQQKTQQQAAADGEQKTQETVDLVADNDEQPTQKTVNNEQPAPQNDQPVEQNDQETQREDEQTQQSVQPTEESVQQTQDDQKIEQNGQDTHLNGQPQRNEYEPPVVPAGPKKVAMSTSIDTDSVRTAYDEVRADNSETQWAVFKFDGPRITASAKGVVFEKFKEQFSDDERAFGYIRLQTGDELSKRQKFLLLTWVGPSVSVLQRAKMSTDKSIIKGVISNFAVELQLETQQEFELSYFTEALNKAGGANYGTGVREI